MAEKRHEKYKKRSSSKARPITETKFFNEAFEKIGNIFMKGLEYRKKTGKEKNLLIDAVKMLSKDYGINPARSYSSLGKVSESIKDYSQAAEMYEKARENFNAARMYAESYKKSGDVNAYKKAIKYAKNADKEGLIHSAEEIYSKLGLRPESKASKNIGSIVTSILAFGGLGLIFSLFSKTKVISMTSQTAQLAPPFPNYMIYVFSAMLICGAGYFIVSYIKKKRNSQIPLSF